MNRKWENSKHTNMRDGMDRITSQRVSERKKDACQDERVEPDSVRILSAAPGGGGGRGGGVMSTLAVKTGSYYYIYMYTTATYNTHSI